MMDEIKDEFDKLNKGKYKYSLSFQVRVRNNVGDKVKYHNEDRSGEFKDDREKKIYQKAKLCILLIYIIHGRITQ